MGCRTMKSFKEYLDDARKSYTYRIKTIVPIEDGMMEKIEHVLEKYDAVEISRPRATIFQKNPMDFSDIDASEVFIIDVVTSLPASSNEIMLALRNALNIPEKFIVVRGEHEPIEQYNVFASDAQDIAAVAAGKNLTPAALLSTNPVSPENEVVISGSSLFGDEYNKSLLHYLANVSKKTDAPELAGEDFNKEFSGPKPVPYWERDEDAIAPLAGKLGRYNNIQDTVNPHYRTYEDKNGEKVIVKKEHGEHVKK